MSNNIFEVVTGDNQPYTALVDAVVFAGLAENVKDSSLMVFAPKESVFASTPDHYKWNKEFTKDLLLNHVTNKEQLTSEAKTLTTAAENTLVATEEKISKNNGEDADIVIESKNTEFVYNVNGFVIPKSQASVTTVSKNLLEASTKRLQDAGLVGSVSDGLKTTLQELRDVQDSPNFDANYGFTVFLPTEEAFLNLKNEVENKKGFNEFLESGGLDHTLLAHTRVGGQKVEKSDTFTSANTKTSYTDIVVDLAENDNTVKIAGVEAKIINVDPFIYKNGAVHEIDQVLYFPRNTTVEVAKVAAETLSSLLKATELDVALDGLAESTVFAPTDAALEPVTCYNNWEGVDAENLKKLLQHHVLDDRVYYETVDGVASNGNVATSLINEVIKKGELNFDNDQLDVLATNGNIHVINKVLIPDTLKDKLPTGTIVDVASTATPKLADFVSKADLVGALSSCPKEGKAYTVFAPKDTAFDALSAADVEYLTANNNEMLTKVLLHHVVSAPAFSTDLKAQQKFTTLNGDEVEVTKSEAGVSVGGAGALVENADNKAFNGVIHIIDKVLIPEGVVLPSTSSASMTTVSLISSALVGAASYFLAAF